MAAAFQSMLSGGGGGGARAGVAVAAAKVEVPADFRHFQMRALDEHLRCPICQEWLRIPMMLPACSHTFCSECIRRHLNFQKQQIGYTSNCPVCNKACIERDLCPNRLVENVVECFKGVRTHLVAASNHLHDHPDSPVPHARTRTTAPPSPSKPGSATAHTADGTTTSSSSSGGRGASRVGAEPRPRQKAAAAHGEKSRKRSRKDRADTARASTTAPAVIEVLDDSGDEFVALSKPAPSASQQQRKRRRKSSGASSQEGRAAATPAPGTTTAAAAVSPAAGGKGTSASGSPPDATPEAHATGSNSSMEADVTPGPEMHACPVCGKMFLPLKLNAHLDLCLAQPETRSVTASATSSQSTPSAPAVFGSAAASSSSGQKRVSKPAGPRRKPLAKVVYKLKKDKALRQLLKDAQLSAVGTRDQLVRRHEEYVMLYNAECDALHPLPTHQIAKEVKRREAERTRNAKTTHRHLRYDSKTPEADIEAQQKAYVTSNKDSFAELIAQARKTRKLGTKKQSEGSGSSGAGSGKGPMAEVGAGFGQGSAAELSGVPDLGGGQGLAAAAMDDAAPSSPEF